MPKFSYVISCTPRSGGHLLAGGLDASGIAGHPMERFPRPTAAMAALSAAEREALVTDAPPESSYDMALDAAYIDYCIREGMTPNEVFGITIHWFQMNDAIRRIKSYIKLDNLTPSQCLSKAFGPVSYIWLRRRDKVAQAVSWYKAVETGKYVKPQASSTPTESGDTALPFNYDKIKFYLSALRSFDNGWQYYFTANHLQPLTLFYEDLAKDYEATVRSAFAFLKLDRVVDIGAPRHAKAADARSEEWIERFKSLQQRR